MQEEEVKFHKTVKVFSQKLQTNREIIDLDASDTEQMAEPADVLLAAEDADGYEAAYAEDALEVGIFDDVCSQDEEEAEHMFD